MKTHASFLPVTLLLCVSLAHVRADIPTDLPSAGTITGNTAPTHQPRIPEYQAANEPMPASAVSRKK